MTQTRGYFFALLATLVWSGNFIVARGLADVFPPVTLSFSRWFIASACLLPFALPAVRRQWPLVKQHWRYLLLTSLLGVALFNTLVYTAGQRTAAVHLALIMLLMPVVVIVLSRLLLGEPITRRKLAGLGLALAGAALLITRGDPAMIAHSSFNSGDLIMIAAAIIFGLYTMQVRRRPPGLSDAALLCVTFVAGAVMIAPFAGLELLLAPPQETFTPRVIAGVLYVGLGPSLISYFSWNKALASIGPTKAGMIYYLIPLFCAVEAWLLLGEPVTWLHAASGGLILAGVATANRSSVPAKT